MTAQPRLWAPGPDITPGDLGRSNAPTVNNSSCVTCQAPAASNKVSLGQGRRFPSLVNSLRTSEGKTGGSLGVRAFFILDHVALHADIPGSSPRAVLAGAGGPGAVDSGGRRRPKKGPVFRSGQPLGPCPDMAPSLPGGCGGCCRAQARGGRPSQSDGPGRRVWEARHRAEARLQAERPGLWRSTPLLPG